MGRWEPDARGRLAKAAMALYAEQGFEQTTVAEIAARAGLTERTFFRHFADKPEVLFAGQAVLQERVLAAIAGAPDVVPPLDVVAGAFEAASDMFDREFARRRQAVIAANAELRERELTKLDTLAEAMAGALRGRGVAEPAAWELWGFLSCAKGEPLQGLHVGHGAAPARFRALAIGVER